MSLGFAVASMKSGAPEVAVFADTRVSMRDQDVVVHSNRAVKAFDLGDRFAMVAAGAALPPISTTEIVRRFVLSHDRNEPARQLGLCDVARMTAYFLAETRSAASDNACEAVVAGFYSSGAPGLAHIHVSLEEDRISFYRALPHGVIVIPVGVPEGTQLINAALGVAKESGKPLVTSALSMLWHLINDPGEDFASIGGGITGATCSAGAPFSWPALQIVGRKYLYGLDVTDNYRATWPTPLALPYDAELCVSAVARLQGQPVRSGGKFVASFGEGSQAVRATRDVALHTVVDKDNVFMTRGDPPGLANE
jgi:hypothetical protein